MTPSSTLQTPYWRGVYAVMNELPDVPAGGVLYITSIPQPGGDPLWKVDVTFAVADRKRVAQRLYEHTHRLSSEAEIQRYHADERQRAADLALAESSRKQREHGVLLEGPPSGDDQRIKTLESQLADMKARLDSQANGGKHGK